jgi:mRNA interferase MazF
MTTYNFGDVVLANFPFTNQQASKKRPAVIVSSDKYHEERDDVIIMAITSNLDDWRVGDVLLKHWEESGLIEESMAKAVFLSLEKSLVFRKLGKLAAEDAETVKESIKAAFG